MPHAFFKAHSRRSHAPEPGAGSARHPARMGKPAALPEFHGHERQPPSRGAHPAGHEQREISLGTHEGVRTIKVRQSTVVWRKARKLVPETAATLLQAASALPDALSAAPAGGEGKRSLLSIRKPVTL